jgi:hypothetical protein
MSLFETLVVLRLVLRVSLFITCYNDTLFPETCKAVVWVLDQAGTYGGSSPQGKPCRGRCATTWGIGRGDAAAGADCGAVQRGLSELWCLCLRNEAVRRSVGSSEISFDKQMMKMAHALN